MNWFVILVTAALLGAFPGYGGAQPVAKPSQSEATKATGGAAAQEAPTPEERKAYEKKMAEELDVLETKIGDLRVKVARLPSQKKRMALFHMNYLVNQASAAKTQLGNLVNSQGGAWNQARATLDMTMRELSRNVADAEVKYT